MDGDRRNPHSCRQPGIERHNLELFPEHRDEQHRQGRHRAQHEDGARDLQAHPGDSIQRHELNQTIQNATGIQVDLRRILIQ